MTCTSRNDALLCVAVLVALSSLLAACDIVHAVEMSERQDAFRQANASRGALSAGNAGLRGRRAELAAMTAAAQQRHAAASCVADTERARVQVARRRRELRLARALWLLCASRASASESERACWLGLATAPSDEPASCVAAGGSSAATAGCGTEPPPSPPLPQLADGLGIVDTATCPMRAALDYAY
jgi:hypothetical protein